MKIYLVRCLTVLFLSVLFISYLSAEEMSSRDRIFHDKITSGRLHDLKEAAKLMHRGGPRNEILQDALAEVLHQHHAMAFDRQIDTLSWVSRALGASNNGRYHSLLAEVASSGAHKKLRKHAKKALKELGGKRGKAQFKPGKIKIPADSYYN